jgi:hypothetical protein
LVRQNDDLQSETGDRLHKNFPHMAEAAALLENVRHPGDLKLFDFQSFMLLLLGANRYITTSFQTLDQRSVGGIGTVVPLVSQAICEGT